MEKKDNIGRLILLGVQHAFAMFCATILVPILTGLNPAVALFGAGIGTLIFHLCTGGKMPVFLGSSFAYISALCIVINGDVANIPKAMGGIICAGIVYLLVALLIKLFGSQFIDKLFPPVVRGVGIAIIGLCLSSTAINNIQLDTQNNPLTGMELTLNWVIAAVVLLIAIVITSYCKGLLKLSGIIIALVTGYVLSIILVTTGVRGTDLMDFSLVTQKNWFEVPGFSFPPVFDLNAIALIAPISLITAVEHVGDVYANGTVVGKNFTKDPGLHRTMMGDGLATIVAGFFGGPANTTYSENTAVLATTGNYNPVTLRIAAVFAIVISFCGKFIGIIQTIPRPVLGGICILLYGMIASVGLRTLVENKVDFSKNRNLAIAAVMLVLAIGGAVIQFSETVSLSGIGLGILAGIILNLVLPEKKASATSYEGDDPEVSPNVKEQRAKGQ